MSTDIRVATRTLRTSTIEFGQRIIGVPPPSQTLINNPGTTAQWIDMNEQYYPPSLTTKSARKK